MKTNKCLNIVLLLLFYPCTVTLSQDYSQPYIVNSIIGDTLTKSERDNYLLFQEIDGFNWAVFYLKQDSVLDAKVNYHRGGADRDTLIENYKKLKSLDYHIRAKNALDQGITVSSLSENKAKEYNSAKGEIIKVIRNNGEETYGELLFVRKNSLLLYKSECYNNLFMPDCVWKENQSELKRVIIKGNSNFGLGIILGILTGVVVGGIVFDSYNDGNICWGRDAIVPTILSTVGCITLGATAGIATSNPDNLIEIFSEQDIQGLSKYARFQYEEPSQLKAIK
ncbi:MAG: hypothetical protein KGZ85_14020 [Ignavibacterium sp.]|nr:hypothetical protein [Ignavibacterium sp.]